MNKIKKWKNNTKRTEENKQKVKVKSWFLKVLKKLKR